MKLNEEIQKALDNVVKAQEAVNAFRETLCSTRRQEFLNAGGCPTCNGHGIVLTWSTLDGSGYDEFGPCGNPSCTAKTVGVDITSSYPSSSRHFHKKSSQELAKTPQEEAHANDLDNALNAANDALEASRDKWTPSKGKTIEVTRSGKGSIKGQKGVVFWTKETYSGPKWSQTKTLRIGAKSEDGTVFWTTEKSCKLIETETKQEKGVLITATQKKETEKAFLLTVKGKDIWVPKSQVKKLNNVGFVLSKWIAEQNGLV